MSCGSDKTTVYKQWSHTADALFSQGAPPSLPPPIPLEEAPLMWASMFAGAKRGSHLKTEVVP